jgi:signal transduction histidine kinase
MTDRPSTAGRPAEAGPAGCAYVGRVTRLEDPRRWLVALLAAAFLVDLLLVVSTGRLTYAYALPGAAGLLACVYLAVSWPGWAALAAVAVLTGSSLVIRAAGMVPPWVGIRGMLLSEVLAGGALVVLLAWRARPEEAIAGISGLVLAGMLAIRLRSGYGPELPMLVFGLVLLVVCLAAGTYLRRSGEMDSDLRALVRRQWPLGAALSALLLFDIGTSGVGLMPSRFEYPQGVLELFALAGAGVAAGCAFLAPRAPTRFALVGAAAIGLTTLVPLAAVGLVPRFGQTPFSLTQLAASMALVAFACRYAAPQSAAWSTVALIVANASLVDASRAGLLSLIFVLIVSVAAGLYFRGRDRERTQTVRVAVTGAQQAERMALARELHDVVAHHVTGIVVAAQAARLVADRDPALAAGALEKIENSGTEALTAMRMLVGSLRGAEPAGESGAAGQATSDLAADIRALVDRFEGPAVDLELALPDTLPAEMGRSVLRLVQESLTNVSKHAAGATGVRVDIRTATGDLGEELHVFVKDDGTARRTDPAGGSGGYGLIGMRERVELLGGRFGAGPGSDGGWVVKVSLPLWSRR